MARRRGNEMDTRGALLDAAWDLFKAHGYDGTSVDAIVERSGLSKGTFFHYYPSKAQLLEAVCDRVAAAAWSALEEHLVGSADDAVGRLNLLIDGMRQWGHEHTDTLVDLYRALAREENALLRVRLTDRLNALFLAPMQDVLASGTRQGVFTVDDVEETARQIGALVSAAGEENLKLFVSSGARKDDVHPDAWRVMAKRNEALLVAIERITGTPCGSLSRPSPGGVGRRGERA
jgi:AcrR family transcriptional regulator